MSIRPAVSPRTSRSGFRYGTRGVAAAFRISSAYGYPACTLPSPALYAASAFRRSPCSAPSRCPMNRPYARNASRGTNGEPFPHSDHVPGSNCAMPSAPAGLVTDGSQDDSRSICAATTGTGTPDARDAPATIRRYSGGTTVDSGTGHPSAGAAPAERAHVTVALRRRLRLRLRLLHRLIIQVNPERILEKRVDLLPDLRLRRNPRVVVAAPYLVLDAVVGCVVVFLQLAYEFGALFLAKPGHWRLPPAPWPRRPW